MADQPKSRAEIVAAMPAHLVADVRMYATSDGGRKSTILSGWGCPCMVSRAEPLAGYDGWPQLGNTLLKPGDERRLGFVFLSPEGANVMRAAGRVYLWEGRFVGEARVVG